MSAPCPVIPAQAGIQEAGTPSSAYLLDSRLRGNDGVPVAATRLTP